jgi:hypothetical protein
MPRGRGVRISRDRSPIQGRVLRGRVVEQEGPLNRPVDRRRRRGVNEHPELQQIKPHAQAPHKQMKSAGVQAVINGDDRNVNNVFNTDLMLFTCNNETDIFTSKSTKDKIWNLEYTDFSLLLRQNFNCQSEKHNFLSHADGKLLIHLTNKPLKVKQIDSIEISTDAFINYDKVMINRYPLLAGELLSCMSIIKGAVVDAPFNRVYQYDQQFRLRIACNQTRTWSQIDGNNLSQKGRKVVKARQQLRFQFLLKSHVKILISEKNVSKSIVCINILA